MGAAAAARSPTIRFNFENMSNIFNEYSMKNDVRETVRFVKLSNYIVLHDVVSYFMILCCIDAEEVILTQDS